jgi:RimJ/RimL family protein N-acetyltransferase
MNFNRILENDIIQIVPLNESDFEKLYSIAKDPLIWQQHPNPDRYKQEVFEVYFKGAIESKSAFLVLDKKQNIPIGSSRFYDLNLERKSLSIGYTFIARSHWGGKYNTALKTIMLNYAFQFVDNVIFHIGANNIRSQTSIQRLGAKKIGEELMSYYGEEKKLNYLYQIEKKDWIKD